MGRAVPLRLLGAVLALLSTHVHCSSSSRRQLLQGSTITAPFEDLPTLPAISWQQQPQPWQQHQQQQPPQQQQQPYQQGPGQQSQYQLQQQQQQGPGQQGPQQQQKQPQQQPQQQQPQQQQGNSQPGNMDNLAISSSSQSDVAHAPSIGFGAPTLAASVGLQLPAYLQGAQMSQAFAPAPGPALGPAQGPEGTGFEKLQAAAPSAEEAEEGEVCLGATKQMVTGQCLPFMAQFQLQGPALARMSDAAFRQAVAIGPTPTDQCCRDAKAFVSRGCSCNAAAAGFAPSIGMTQKELQLSARASVMACPHFSISDPCADA